MTNLEKTSEISTLGANRAGEPREENFHWLTRALLRSTQDFRDKVFIDVIARKEFSLKCLHEHRYVAHIIHCLATFIVFPNYTVSFASIFSLKSSSVIR